MPKPNVNFRTREVGWVWGVTNGTATNTSATGQGHGLSAALAAGGQAICTPLNSIHGILGGARVFSRGFVTPATLEPTRAIGRMAATHGLYAEITAHLRSSGDVDLPAVIRIFFNDLWPTAAAVANPDLDDMGDWVTNGVGPATQGWQEWEEFSPITVPTPPPGFSAGGATGARYEHRRKLGRVPANFFFALIENAGSVSATEWGMGIYLRSHP